MNAPLSSAAAAAPVRETPGLQVRYSKPGCGPLGPRSPNAVGHRGRAAQLGRAAGPRYDDLPVARVSHRLRA
ncbi:hypothetical protein GCM10010502_13860 [Kitasatospora aureofaciens]|uniref:Uncharacterized protein n=1 Tax=Kitasatospora aureofaciens TaxID=1894 RepID=A0A8H9HGZ1_KITAU|nr:hypothetical protein GCM10010502_13860 [Kitasatospora aureofaciens]